MTRFLIGVDEAGRGALAGPVCVGAVLCPSNFDWREGFALVTPRGEPRLRDSKQLSAKQRDIVYTYLIEYPRLRCSFAFVEAETIDVIGIANAACEAADVAVSRLGAESLRVKVLLDAGLSISRFRNQESFIRGDERIPSIALASIVAKVVRDRHMEAVAVSHAAYGFERHKGYGTREHFDILRKVGPGIAHRKSFLGRVRL